MGKLLLLLILALVVYLAVRSAYRRSKPGRSEAAVEDMVACERCGVNLPRSEAIESRGRYFCSQEHRTAAEA